MLENWPCELAAIKSDGDRQANDSNSKAWTLESRHWGSAPGISTL